MAVARCWAMVRCRRNQIPATRCTIDCFVNARDRRDGRISGMIGRTKAWKVRLSERM